MGKRFSYCAGPKCLRIRAFLLMHHLPIGLALAVIIGFLWPTPGAWIAQAPINTISICGIFFLSGLQLRTDEIKQALGTLPNEIPTSWSLRAT